MRPLMPRYALPRFIGEMPLSIGTDSRIYHPLRYAMHPRYALPRFIGYVIKLDQRFIYESLHSQFGSDCNPSQ